MSGGTDGCCIGEGTATKETEKAILVLLMDDGEFDEEVWIPKTVIHDDSEIWKVGHEGKIVVERWWASKEGREP